MLKFKMFALVLVSSFVLSACNFPGETDEVAMSPDQMEHIGCQEGEIDVNGNCEPAFENNVELFGQDFVDELEVREVKEDVLGFLAKPKEPGNYPGVILIHEWWGLNENIKEMAQILANEGYVVFAVDLFEGEIAKESDTARVLSGRVRSNPEKAVEEMQNVVKYLKEEEGVSKVASLGWCFGGEQSLNLSLQEQLDATVIYYGRLTDDSDRLKNISAPVLGIFGDQDTSISVESVNSFENVLNDLEIENDIYIYSGVGHAFANPSGSNYAKTETLDAWEKTVEFLNMALK